MKLLYNLRPRGTERIVAGTGAVDYTTHDSTDFENNNNI